MASKSQKYAFNEVPQNDVDKHAEATGKKKGKKGKKKVDLDNLKREMEMDEHKIPLDALIQRYGSNIQNGLTTQKAKEVMERDGRNELTPPKTTPEWVKFCKQLFGGFSILLWIGAILCYFAYAIEASAYEDVRGDNVSINQSIKQLINQSIK